MSARPGMRGPLRQVASGEPGPGASGRPGTQWSPGFPSESLTRRPGHEFRELDAEARAGSRGAAQHRGELGVRIPARSRDVEVRPGLATSELADEHASQYGPGLPILGVPEIGDLAAEQHAVVSVDWQPPHAIAGLAGGVRGQPPEPLLLSGAR